MAFDRAPPEAQFAVLEAHLAGTLHGYFAGNAAKSATQSDGFQWGLLTEA